MAISSLNRLVLIKEKPIFTALQLQQEFDSNRVARMKSSSIIFTKPMVISNFAAVAVGVKYVVT
jgi:hypothetical protein